MRDKLVFRAGVFAGKEFEIQTEEVTIGRDQDNTIVLNDVQISRKHARIFSNKDGLFIEDLKSTNGSLLNGKKIKRTQKIKDGDVITLGEQNIFEIQFALNKESASLVGKNLNEPALSPEMKIGANDHTDEKVELMQESEDHREEKRTGVLGKFPTWAMILMIAIAFLIVFCLIPLVVIEVTDQWCNLFSGFFNAISPGVCP